MAYNLSFMDNATNIADLWLGVNTESSSWLAGLTLIFIFLFVLMVFTDYDMKDVLLADSFIVTILAGILMWLGALPGIYIGIPIGVFVITLMIKVWGDS